MAKVIETRGIVIDGEPVTVRICEEMEIYSEDGKIIKMDWFDVYLDGKIDGKMCSKLVHIKPEYWLLEDVDLFFRLSWRRFVKMILEKNNSVTENNQS